MWQMAFSLACGLSAVLQPAPTIEAKPAANPVERYEEAAAFLDSKCYRIAADKLEQFVHDFPQDKKASEAAYKMGCAYLLQGEPASAKKAFRLLVSDYFDSPWAQLALLSQFEPDELFTLANEKRDQGRQRLDNESLRIALKLYELATARGGPPPNPKNGPDREEIIFKAIDCLHRLGISDQEQSGLESLRRLNKDSPWTRLAEIKSGGDRAFKEHLEDLVRMSGVQTEHFSSFLELADSYASTLGEADKVKCLFYQAVSNYGLKKNAEALALYERICKEHSTTSWAAEAAFQVAEHEFAAGNFAKAKEAYQAIVAKYPQSRRAVQAGQWARWINHFDENWKQFEASLSRLVEQSVGVKGGLGICIVNDSKDPRKAFRARLAFQDQEHLHLSITVGATGMLLVNNPEETWYRSLDQDVMVRAKERMQIPVPNLCVKEDPVTNGYRMEFLTFAGSDSPSQKPVFEIPPSITPYLVNLLKGWCHLGMENRPDGKGGQRTIFTLQQMSWEEEQPRVWEVETQASGTIHEIRFITHDDKGQQRTWTVSNLCLGGKLDAGEFAVSVPDGVRLRDVEQINAFEVLGQFMKMMGAAGQEVKSDLKQP